MKQYNNFDEMFSYQNQNVIHIYNRVESLSSMDGYVDVIVDDDVNFEYDDTPTTLPNEVCEIGYDTFNRSCSIYVPLSECFPIVTEALKKLENKGGSIWSSVIRKDEEAGCMIKIWFSKETKYGDDELDKAVKELDKEVMKGIGK